MTARTPEADRAAEAHRWIQTLGQRFIGRFPAEVSWRTVGRESEFPLVRPDGAPGELSELWPILAELRPGMAEKREASGLQVELAADDYSVVAEVGRGTVELVLGPQRDLHGTHAVWERAMDHLQAAAARADQRVLGYGIQPGVDPDPALMTPKQRYGVLLDTIGETWLWFALTASDQCHARVARDEVIGLTNLAHLMTPLIIALCANSPIYGGRPCGAVSARELTMGRIHSAMARHGMPFGPDADVDGLVERLVGQPFLVRVRGGRYEPMQGRFIDQLLDGVAAGELDEDGAFTDFLMHEHYIWNSARPRSAHGTLELRAACQQPLHEHMAAAALNVAIVAAAPALAALLDRELGDAAWPAMRAWHHAAMHSGLAAPAPTPGLAAQALALCHAALEARGAGEERYLQPLFDRLDRGRNPAQEALLAFDAGGLPGLCAHAARR
jgi:gamma-glutamylcysteine synthetase